MTLQAFETDDHTGEYIHQQTVTTTRSRALLHDNLKTRQFFHEKLPSLKFQVDALDSSSRQSIHTHMFDMNKCSHSGDVDKLCAISIRYDANKDIVVDGAVPVARSARTSFYV